jgi:hypothetical protein
MKEWRGKVTEFLKFFRELESDRSRISVNDIEIQNRPQQKHFLKSDSGPSIETVAHGRKVTVKHDPRAGARGGDARG